MTLTKEQKPLREEFETSIRGITRILENLEELHAKALNVKDFKLVAHIEDALWRHQRKSFFVSTPLVKEYKEGI